MLTKEQLHQTINDLPDEFTLDDVLDRVILLDNIAHGVEQSKAGQPIPQKKPGKS